MTAPMDVAGFVAALGDVPVLTERALIRQKSRDFFWYSPILKSALDRKSAELIVCPRDEADVVRTTALCVARRVPLTVRGAGTGNYGQVVPLEGGVVLDMTALDRILAVEDDVLRVEAGRRLIDIDTDLRPHGRELRMHPSTKRTATIGGFVGGGSGGIGSINHGGLRDRGNVLAARVVTAEATPRIVELTGDAVSGVNHAYGTTGIMTALSVALAPALPWTDLACAFPDFSTAVRFAHALALSDGIAKKLVTVIAEPLAPMMRGLDAPEGAHLVLAIVARGALPAWDDILAQFGGQEFRRMPSLEAEADPKRIPIYEYTWNHTTLHALRRNRTVTYLQCRFPAASLLETVEAVHRDYAGEVILHLEFIRIAGQVSCSALPVVRFTTADRLAAIIADFERRGIAIANPHEWTLEGGSPLKRLPPGQAEMKAAHDPFGILNPGKMLTAAAPPA